MQRGISLDNYKQIIDDSLDYLYSFNQGLSAHFKPDLKDQNQVYYLCYLIHDLSLWYDAMDIQTRMLSLSLPNLIKERDLLINIK